MDNTALASAGASYQRDMFTLCNVERYIAQDWLVHEIAKRQMIYGDAVLSRVSRLISVWNFFNREIQYLENTFCSREGTLHSLPLLTEGRNGIEEVLKQQDKSRQRSKAHGPSV